MVLQYRTTVGRCSSGMTEEFGKGKKLLPNGEYFLTVVRKNELGAFLDVGTGNTSDDILLHKAQQTQAVEIGDKIRVNLYLDPKKRLAASMKFSHIKEGGIGLGTVISVTATGGFVDIGAERGVFLPFSQMRGKIKQGQTFFVKLYRDKSDRQAVTMIVEDEIKSVAENAGTVKNGTQITGRVYNRLDDGWLIFTEEKFIAFLHKDELIQSSIPEIGEEITGRVIFIRTDGRINISQRQIKEKALDIDADKILEFLYERNGRMPYSDRTPPEIIKEKFLLSKASFKRALGKLMRQGLIIQEDGWTILRDK